MVKAPKRQRSAASGVDTDAATVVVGTEDPTQAAAGVSIREVGESAVAPKSSRLFRKCVRGKGGKKKLERELPLEDTLKTSEGGSASGPEEPASQSVRRKKRRRVPADGSEGGKEEPGVGEATVAAACASSATDGAVVEPSDGVKASAMTSTSAASKEATMQRSKSKALRRDVEADDEEKKDKKGIVHFATVPRSMRPEKLRHLMEQFGETGRVFLAPEDKTEQKRRKKTGGSRKLLYTEGWVEFLDRRVARRVAMQLNRTPVGGKKRHNFYRDDIWNTRYLPGFTWYQLKEGTIYNQQVRKARLDQKIGQAKRENDFFLEKVEQAKARERHARRIASKGGADIGADGAVERFGASTKTILGASHRPRDGASNGVNSTDISDSILSRLL
eukprot:TRINITY_DN19498_c0_g1_i1.p1 TRINITY_DN19498_c0_g1~~TRINITY_DN19498_c0_g1_i1.p1  ORF type:complete len:389 (-),score=75.66 TRINITY_DN19498_c0_g1_i1:33-1199(-)